MPGGWNGSGSFTRYYGTNTWQNDAAAGTLIVADRHDNNDQGLATGIDACLTKNGENAFTGTTGASAFRGAIDNTSDLGSASLRWRNLYAGTSVIFQGATFATTVTAAPTANRSVVLADLAGTMGPPQTLADVQTTSGATQTLVASGMSSTPYSEIVISFDGVSLSGTDFILIQVADQVSGFLTGSYLSSTSYLANGAAVVVYNNPAGFGIATAGAAGTVYGSVVLSRMTVATLPGYDRWSINGSLYVNSPTTMQTVAGQISLTSSTPTGKLDGLRLVASGANTYDAGRVSVLGRI